MSIPSSDTQTRTGPPYGNHQSEWCPSPMPRTPPSISMLYVPFGNHYPQSPLHNGARRPAASRRHLVCHRYQVAAVVRQQDTRLHPPLSSLLSAPSGSLSSPRPFSALGGFGFDASSALRELYTPRHIRNENRTSRIFPLSRSEARSITTCKGRRA